MESTEGYKDPSEYRVVDLEAQAITVADIYNELVNESSLYRERAANGRNILDQVVAASADLRQRYIEIERQIADVHAQFEKDVDEVMFGSISLTETFEGLKEVKRTYEPKFEVLSKRLNQAERALDLFGRPTPASVRSMVARPDNWDTSFVMKRFSQALSDGVAAMRDLTQASSSVEITGEQASTHLIFGPAHQGLMPMATLGSPPEEAKEPKSRGNFENEDFSPEEVAYARGRRSAGEQLLVEVLNVLGPSDEHAWILERSRLVTALRTYCAEHGSQDWKDSDDLSEVFTNLVC